MALADPLRWIVVVALALVVAFSLLFYFLGKARGELKALKHSSQAMPAQPAARVRRALASLRRPDSPARTS